MYLGGNKFSNSHENINHLMYVDDIGVFAKNEKILETQIQTIRIYSQDIKMILALKIPCTMLIMKNG